MSNSGSRLCERWHEGRRKNAAYYDRAFTEAGATPSGESLRSGQLPLHTPRSASPEAAHIYNQYVIRVPADQRDALRETLKERGIATEIYYPLGLHEQQCFAELGYKTGDLPETEGAARGTLALPIYSEQSPEQRNHLVRSILEFLGS